MQRRQAALKLHHAVQHAAAFEQVRGNVLVRLREDRKTREHRVTVVAMARIGVPAVCDLVPDFVGDELVLRLSRPVAITRRMPPVHSLHLLQEQDVGGEAAQAVAQLMDHHAAREMGKPLVDVVGRDGEAHGES